MSGDPLADADRLLGRMDHALELSELEEEHRRNVRRLLLSFVEVKDSLDRLIAGVGPDAGDQEGGLVRTIRLVARQFENVLTGESVVPMDCVGQIVDPLQHEIVGTEQAAGAADDVIIRQIVQGYRWDGTILRKPQVIVAHSAASTQ